MNPLPFAQRWGWRDISYRSLLVAPDRTVSPEEADAIRSVNQRDIELYARALERFET
jgi:hypothetical protein